MTLADEYERHAALNVQSSCIVQAPAGSGKTELLTNRLLALLCTVNNPEEIIAITFTRKAAAEMRSRVLEKLHWAEQIAEGILPTPELAHERLTLALAKAVLARDHQRGWMITQQSSRLRIQTIDALCAALTRQMPYLSRLGGQATIVENADALYESAARSTLHLLEDNDYQDAIGDLLLLCDNNAQQALRLLVSMLRSRDQWLPLLHQWPTENGDCYYEELLRFVVRQELRALAQHVPQDVQIHLIPLAQAAARRVENEHDIAALQLWDHVLDADSDPALWRGLRHLLLTKEATLRKSINKNQGFPPDAREDKTAFLALLKSLENAQWPEQLGLLDRLPRPEAALAQWPLIAHLLTALKLAAGQLSVLFAQRGEVDFIEINQAALRALGDETDPGELALKLDYQIRHLLVDEFQDTSLTQWRLLNKLIMGWAPDDGRTLFLVGDPMQSIYRFRKAEVSLFLQAQQKGLNHSLPLQNLSLQTNFRSQAGIVDWVNKTFQRVFAPRADPLHGAVPYSTSVAHRNLLPDSAVRYRLFVCADKNVTADEQEAAAVVSAVRDAEAAHAESTAILVRSRAHLRAILPALHAAGIAFEAVDIAPLADSAVVSDLQQLAKALWHPGDRLAWLCVLRAPWCGMTAADLFVLCGEQHHRCVAEQLADADIRLLSEDGRQRYLRVWPILHTSLYHQDALPLSARVECAWRALGGEALLQSENERREVQQALLKLAGIRLDDGDILQQIDSLTENLYAHSESGAKLKILTMHKAKGLEFDCVILPGLGRTPRPDQIPLMAWDEFPDDAGNRLLLLAPMEHKAEQGTGTIDFLRAREQLRAEHESKRLLYVAATRSKNRLYLFAHTVKKAEDDVNPGGNSHLALLWPALQTEFLVNQQAIFPSDVHTASTDEGSPDYLRVPLQRLPAHWNDYIATTESHINSAQLNEIPFTRSGLIARATGTVTHFMLEQLADRELPTDPAHYLQSQYGFLCKLLQREGLSLLDSQKAVSTVIKALANTLQSKRGRWILHAHRDAHSEWQLHQSDADEFSQHIIDRSFVDEQDTRWIIDYKILESTEFVGSGGNPEQMLSSVNLPELKRQAYIEQLQRYAALLKSMESRPARLAIYFPLQDLFAPC